MLYTFLCQVFEYNFLLSFMFDTKVLRKIPESLLLVCYYLVTSKQNQTEFQTKKNPVYPRFFLNIQGIILSLYYLFENCGALLADLRPYFLRSFILGSLVRNPAFFKVGLHSSSA